MQRMVQIHARIAISPAERLFVPIKISAGIGREHVTIWQSSGDAVGGRQAGAVALAENKRVLQYPKLTLLVFQRYSHVRCGSKAGLRDGLPKVRFRLGNGRANRRSLIMEFASFQIRFNT
jgi:hypothetical protein